MSELLDKQANVQKESLKKTSGVHASSRKPTKKCAMKMKESSIRRRKNDCCVKKIFVEGRIYKAVTEDWLNQFRRTLGY